MNELDSVRLRRLRAEMFELTSQGVPYDAIYCPRCHCFMLYADSEGQLHCYGCRLELDGEIKLHTE